MEERAEQRHLAFLRRLEERNRQVKEARAKDAARLHAEQLERGFTTHWSGANEDKQRADRDRAARERKQRWIWRVVYVEAGMGVVWVRERETERRVGGQGSQKTRRKR